MNYNTWQTVELGEISEMKYGKMPKKNKIKENGYPIFSGYKIKGYYDEYMYEEPQLIVVARGVGGTGDVKIAPPKSYITNLSIILELDESRVDKQFMYYKLYNENLRMLDSGSAQSQITIKDLKSYKIQLPGLKEQKTISRILSIIDSKIRINHEMNNTLEEFAQTLFKHWFVDFEFPNEKGEPYKSSGGKFVESELGMIPEGWYIGKLTDIAELIMGQSPKGDTYNFEGKGLGLINGASDFKDGKITPLKYTTDPKKVSKKGDWIFGVRATVGNVTYVDKEYCLGRGVGVARALSDKVREYLYFKLIEGINYLEKTALGSVYINLSKSDLENIKFVIPSKKIINRFHEIVSPLFNKININIVENNNLILLRDNLLPKLMSGEIRIPEAEEAVESCLQKNN